MLKVGVIGLGVGAAHAKSFAENEHCDVIALCDFEQDKQDWAKDYFPDAKVGDDAGSLLDNDLDIVVIAGFDDTHHQQVMKALKNDIHVFVEKPMCLYENEAIDIRKTLTASNKFLSSNLCLRTAPLFENVRNAVLDGSMGDVFHMEGDYLWGRLHKLNDGWRSKMDFYSITYGAAVHMIDLLMWISDEKITEVFAYGNNIGGKPANFPFDDFAVILLKFENGATAKVSAELNPHSATLLLEANGPTHATAMFRSEMRKEPTLPVKNGGKLFLPLLTP